MRHNPRGVEEICQVFIGQFNSGMSLFARKQVNLFPLITRFVFWVVRIHLRAESKWRTLDFSYLRRWGVAGRLSSILR